MTRVQIPALNELAGAEPGGDEGTVEAEALSVEAEAVVVEKDSGLQGEILEGTRTRPPVPRGMDELFIPPTLDPEEAVEKAGRRIPLDATPVGLIYRPEILAQANIIYNARKYNVQHDEEIAFLVHDVNSPGNLDWESFEIEPLNLSRLDEEPMAPVLYAALEASMMDKEVLSSAPKSLADWIYRDKPVMIKANETLKVYAGPSVDRESFQALCEEAADERLQAEIDSLEAKYARKFAALETKLKREEQELEGDRADVQRRKQEEYVSYAETFFSFFAGRRRSLSSALSKRGRRSKAQEGVDESIKEIAELKEDIAELETELEEEMEKLEEKWLAVTEEMTEIPVLPYKKDIHIDFFGVAWLPYHVLQSGGRVYEVPAFEFGG